MNANIFRLIYSHRLEMTIPVGEPRRGRGRSAGRTTPAAPGDRPGRPLKRLALCIAGLFATPALALPTGATVSQGSAAVSQNGSTLTVSNSPGAIINWASFSIGQGETARFLQQSSSSAVLNRVVGQDPSQIIGALQSNGRVFLINPNGILFGQTARVDTAGLVASTLALSDADFLAGRLAFTGGSDAGQVENQGTINTSGGGFVYLIAPSVENSGLIRSPQGEIVLAAGHSVEIADGLNPALRVALSAPDDAAINLGQLLAESGRIGLHGGLVHNAGTISAASAVAEGGKIYLRASRAITLGAESKIAADGSRGGEVIGIVSEAGGAGGAISGEFSGGGEISARGDGRAGSGGFVETSAAALHVDGLRVSTGGGQWLLDPNDFTIAASGGDISGAALSAALAGNDVIIQTTAGAASCTGATCGTGTAGNGDIFVDDAVSWNSPQTLTLSAYRNIEIRQSISALDPAGKVALEYGQGAISSGNTAIYNVLAPIDLQAGNNFSTKLGSDGAVTSYTVITSLGVEGDTGIDSLQGVANNLGGNYALGADIDATATATWNPDGSGGFFGFNRIGDNSSFDIFTRYRGAFDGLGHAVSNLTIDRPASNYIGLFGVNSGLIQNINVVNASVTGNASVGTLVGVNFGLIQHAHGSGLVTGTNNLGGLAGAINGGAIVNSSASTTVSGDGLAGGLVGFSQGSIFYSYATGSVTSTSVAGGLVGSNSGATFAATVDNSYATGSVNGAAAAGGLIGSNSSGASVTNSYSTGAVSGSGIGGLIGNDNFGGAITGSYWNTETSGVSFSAAGIGLTTAQMKQQSSFTGWDFSAGWNIDAGATVSYPYRRANEQLPHPGLAAGGPCCSWDGGGTSNSWLDALNWATDTLPGASDTAVIGSATTVTLASGTIGVAGLSIGSGSSFDISGGNFTVTGSTTLDGTLNLSGGSASLNGALNGGTSGVVNITGGTLTLNGVLSALLDLSLNGGLLNTGGAGRSLTVGNQFLWDHGTITGGGSFTVAGDASFANNTSGANAMLLSNQALTIDGNLAVGGQYWLDMNGGDLTVNGATTVDTSAASGFYGVIGASSSDTVRFLGGIGKTAGTQAYVLANLNLIQSGTVSNLAGGDLVFDLGSNSATLDNTSFVADAGTLIKLASGNYNAVGNVSFSGAGNAQIGNSDTRTPVFTVGAGNTVSNSGNLAITSNATLASTGTLINDGNLSTVPDLTIAGGTYQGSGTLVGNLVNTGGTVRPGNSPGTMSITGNYTQGTGGTLLMELAGTTPGSGYDWLDVSGSASLGGTVQVTLLGGFVPASGNVFNLVNAAGGIGYSGINLSLPGAYTFGVSLGATVFSLDLPVAPIPVPIPPPTLIPLPVSGTIALIDATTQLGALGYDTPLLYESGQSSATASASGTQTQTAERVLPAWMPPQQYAAADDAASSSSAAVMPVFNQLILEASHQEQSHESRLVCR